MEKLTAGAIKAGHNCSDRHSRYLGDLAVAQLMKLAQNEHLAQRRRERHYQPAESPQIRSALQQRIGVD